MKCPAYEEWSLTAMLDAWHEQRLTANPMCIGGARDEFSGPYEAPSAEYDKAVSVFSAVIARAFALDVVCDPADGSARRWLNLITVVPVARRQLGLQQPRRRAELARALVDVVEAPGLFDTLPATPIFCPNPRSLTSADRDDVRGRILRLAAVLPDGRAVGVYEAQADLAGVRVIYRIDNQINRWDPFDGKDQYLVLEANGVEHDLSEFFCATRLNLYATPQGRVGLICNTYAFVLSPTEFTYVDGETMPDTWRYVGGFDWRDGEGLAVRDFDRAEGLAFFPASELPECLDRHPVEYLPDFRVERWGDCMGAGYERQPEH
ncbi:hypothetical protein [Asticcacaulis biprosthecium]|uniref:hypothetical protein n=1 Tax=Asticcacaulis biprosthecium TaxID=76891 RepID=UPI0012F4C0C2|nr:hypothetical protein [Asticcacaulis biprosthecium]